MQGSMRRALIGGLGLGWMLVWAGSLAGAPTVTVEYVPPHLTVRISEATDLHTVLAAVCAQTQARCDLPAPAAAVPVAPTIVEGTWGEVVAKLLQGSGLRFATLPPEAGHEAQLVVLGSSGEVPGAPAQPLSSGSGVASDSSSVKPAAGGVSGAAPASTRETPSGSPVEMTPSSASVRGLQAAPSSDTAGTKPQPSTLSGDVSQSEGGHSEALGGSQTTGPAAALPIHPVFGLGTGPPGALRRPPAPGTTMVYPFPDPHGNPVVVTIPSEPLRVLPFPGPDGQPVPVPPPQPLKVFPFPGPDGQPVPIPSPPTAGTPSR